MGSAEIKTRKMLVLCQAGRLDAATRESLAHLGEIREVQSCQDALDKLQSQEFDLVVTDAADFLALEGSAASEQEGRILDSIGQGICILDPDGKILWTNRKMQSFPHEVCDALAGSCREAFAKFDTSTSHSTSHVRARRFGLAAARNRAFEVTATPVLDPGGRIQQVVALVWDTTNERRLKRKLEAIDKAGAALVRLDAGKTDQLTVPQRLELFEKRIIGYTRDLMSFDNFAIRLLDEGSNKLELVCSAGLTEEGKNVTLYADPENNGISGYVAATGKSYICSNTTKDPRYIVGIGNARSSLTVPLWLHDQVIGVFNVEHQKTNAFDEDDRKIAEIFARYVAFALHILDLLVTERYTTTGELAGDVSSHVAGPLNDILAEATAVMDQYIGDDELRGRLQAITDNVNKIKDCMKQVSEPGMRHLVNIPERPAADPLFQGKSVLVADDESIIRETISEILTGSGCRVETARQGAEAIAMLHQRSYDLIIADIKMPHANGYEVFAAAKKKCPTCPVILITGFGYDPHHSIIRANKEDLAAVLFKPFKVDQLLSEVRKALVPV